MIILRSMWDVLFPISDSGPPKINSKRTLNTLNLQFKYTKYIWEFLLLLSRIKLYIGLCLNYPYYGSKRKVLLKNIDSFLKIVWKLTLFAWKKKWFSHSPFICFALISLCLVFDSHFVCSITITEKFDGKV